MNKDEQGTRLNDLTIGTKTYKVFKLTEGERVSYAYRLEGPRANYWLLRNYCKPDMMFVIDVKGKCSSVFDGFWFTDENGELRPA